MLLITKDQYEQAYRRDGRLVIGEYDPANYVGTSYYFRLGARNEGSFVLPIETELVIQPNEFIRAWSLESVHLGGDVLGIFGSTSLLIQSGLQLLNSPSIDPGFAGLLEIGIKNVTDQRVRLKPQAYIGKALFFDVADSNVKTDQFVKGILTHERVERRARAEHDLRELERDHDEKLGLSHAT